MPRLALARAFGALLLSLPFQSLADEKHREPGHGPEEIVVTGNPLERSADELSKPVTVLAGDELVLETEPTLGETLAQQPGVTSSYFGPAASRPIIRGLDADHIRVLQNGLGSIDASAASADHAVSIDPLAIERVEIMRGPSALLYGPTGVGGVVNVIDNRIPDEPFEGMTGMLEGAIDSVARGRSGATVLEAGVNGWNIHTDGLAHRSRDVTIPGLARSGRLRRDEPLPPGEAEPRNQLENSQIDTYGGSIGVSYAGERGYLGFAPSAFDSSYGVVKEEEVTIDMRQRRWDFAGGIDEPFAGVAQLRGRFASSDYQHVEFEGAEQGTVFKNRGYEGRLELLHAPVGPLRGAIGGQAYRSKFSAIGEEAFLPRSTTRAWSAFVFEELAASAQLGFQFGGRVDWTNVDSQSDPDFGPGQTKDRRTGSLAVGASYDFDDTWAIAFSYAYTQRPPLAQELFADGPHVATDAFEIGDPGLGVEKSLGFDASLSKRAGFATGSLSGFYYFFDDFISLVPTGEVQDDLDVFRYVNQPATFLGGEAELTLHLVETSAHVLHLDLRADYTRARDRDSGEPLPRIPPFRFGAELAYHRGPLHLSGGAFWVAAQHRVAPEELPTEGYTLLDASLSYEILLARTRLLLFANGTNLANQTARNASSFLKDVAPLPGRGVRFGVRMAF